MDIFNVLCSAQKICLPFIQSFAKQGKKTKFRSLLNLYFFYGNDILVLRKEVWLGFYNGASLYSKGNCVVQILFQVSSYPLA